MQRIRILLALVLVAVLGSAALAGPAVAGARKDIVQTAVAARSFRTLTRLVTDAGLVRTLKGRGPYTVFAPTDAAFAKVPDATLARLARDRAMLRAVLLHHVAAGRLTAARIVRRSAVRMLDGQRVGIRVRGNVVRVGGARVVTPDVTASNGVIHAIDRVLLPR